MKNYPSKKITIFEQKNKLYRAKNYTDPGSLTKNYTNSDRKLHKIKTKGQKTAQIRLQG